MDKTVKFGLAIMILFLLLAVFGITYLFSLLVDNENVAIAADESPFTLIGTPPGTKNVLVYMLRQQGGVATYTCFLVITQIAADISCP